MKATVERRTWNARQEVSQAEERITANCSARTKSNKGRIGTDPASRRASPQSQEY